MNIIYYLQHICGKKNGVTKEDLEMFLRELYHVDREVFSNIIKPWKSLEDTLKELLEQELIIEISESSYVVNGDKIREENDLIYWRGIRGGKTKIPRQP